jgi:hypothetical protein
LTDALFISFNYINAIQWPKFFHQNVMGLTNNYEFKVHYHQDHHLQVGLGSSLCFAYRCVKSEIDCSFSIFSNTDNANSWQSHFTQTLTVQLPSMAERLRLTNRRFTIETSTGITEIIVGSGGAPLYSFATVAAALDLTASQVTNHLHAARRRFRELALEHLRAAKAKQLYAEIMEQVFHGAGGLELWHLSGETGEIDIWQGEDGIGSRFHRGRKYRGQVFGIRALHGIEP